MSVPRAQILADLIERRRILAEAKALRAQLQALIELRRVYAAESIAQRHQITLRRVNTIAASIRWIGHSPKRKLSEV